MIELDKQDFEIFKFRLFKKFGRDTEGNAIFINSTISDINNFIKSSDFNNIGEIYAYYRTFDKEYIYKLQSIEDREYFFRKNISEYESVNIFNKDLSWVITLFNKNAI